MKARKNKRRAKAKRGDSRPFFFSVFAGVVLGILMVVVFGVGSDSGVPRTADIDTPHDEDVVVEPEVQPDLSPAPRDQFTMVAVGDILLTRSVGTQISNEGWEYPFRGTGDIFETADLAFANLECPASFLGAPYPGKPLEVTFRAQPGALLGLKRSGLDVLSLANNHMNDYGAAALSETLDALDTLNLAHCGAGRNEDEARTPAILTVNDTRVAVLAYVAPMWSATAASDKSGVAIMDESAMVADIGAARDVADFVVVSLHWGEEHRIAPREETRALARRLVEAGASAILGHHPHVLQGAEFHRGAPILYSLGNFIFDMAASTTYQSAAVYIRFSRTAPVELRYVPVRIERRTYAPARAEGDDAMAIGRIIQKRCAMLGSPSLLGPDGSVLLHP